MLILASILLVGFIAAGVYLYAFRTITLSQDPVTWINIKSVKLGSAKIVLPEAGTLEYRFDKEVDAVPRPDKVTGCIPTLWWCQDEEFRPSRWEVSPVETFTSPGGYSTSSYGFELDLDRDDAGLPDVGIIVTFVGAYGDDYRYNVKTFVAAKDSGTQSASNEYYWWFENTYFVVEIDPWFKMERAVADGAEIVKPGEACIDRGDCKWIVPVAAKSPSEPISSTFSLAERFFPWLAGQRAIVISYSVDIYVDSNVVAAYAPTTLYVPTVTMSGGRTVTVTNPTTVVITEKQTITKTISFLSVRMEYVTIEGTATRTVTTWIPAGTTITTTGAGKTVTTVVVKPGETVTKTVIVERTVTATPSMPTDICSLWPELCQIAPPAVLVLIVVIVIMVIVLAIISAASARSRPPSRGRGRRA
jgi:hypothetical protein